ncbi:hypothetical protein Goari_001006 [Gossypium aridum]|uniref:Uncharacterized protein n=1 Tax=Gossypium aridum TaxID=34290 RepID=A0A7J8YIH0_GOSAI|nr:hypothetical protein [Gossypium aridum]
MQQEKGDSLTEGYMLELWDFTRISVTQNNLQNLKEISTYFELWPSIGIPPIVDLLLRRAVNVLTFLKRLMSITRISEQWAVAQIKQKGDIKCIP